MESVRRMRREKGLSQQELAVLAGVGQDSISAIETGKHEPHPRTLRKLANALDVEVADFFREPAVPLAEAPREVGQTSLSTEWLETHGGRRLLMSDEEIVRNFGRLASGPDREAIPDRFEQEWNETVREEASVENALTKEWTRGGSLLPQPEEGPSVVRRAFDRHKEYSRLKREVLRSYGRYYRALGAFSKFLYFGGQADDYVIVNKRPQAVEAERAATRALQEEAFEDVQGA
jgi:transcriptional regulator with XRE-family HTH domain